MKLPVGIKVLKCTTSLLFLINRVWIEFCNGEFHAELSGFALSASFMCLSALSGSRRLRLCENGVGCRRMRLWSEEPQNILADHLRRMKSAPHPPPAPAWEHSAASVHMFRPSIAAGSRFPVTGGTWSPFTRLTPRIMTFWRGKMSDLKKVRRCVDKWVTEGACSLLMAQFLERMNHFSGCISGWSVGYFIHRWYACVCSDSALLHLSSIIFMCHRGYHGYYRLPAVFSLRRTQVRCPRVDEWHYSFAFVVAFKIKFRVFNYVKWWRFNKMSELWVHWICFWWNVL